MIGLREDRLEREKLVLRINQLFSVARELAPAGPRSGPKEWACYAVQREQAPSPQ